MRAHSVIVVDDAADELLDAALTLGRPNLAAEILRDDDVGRLLRPELRNLDVALLEHDLAALVADHGRAQLPLDLVERIDACFREEARERKARRGGRFLRARLVGFRRTPGLLVALPLLVDRLLARAGRLVGRSLFHDSSTARNRTPTPKAIAILLLD